MHLLTVRPPLGHAADVQASRHGRSYEVGSAETVAWIAAGVRPYGLTVDTAVPPVFEAYATVHQADGEAVAEHERALVDVLLRHTAGQPWWLGYLDTGAHDVVLPQARRVPLYSDWPYVLVKAGPAQALSWRTGHLRDGAGSLPDLFFPQDRSWLVSSLWDDTWTCLGGSVDLVDALTREPLLHGRRVALEDDTLPPGLHRD